MSAWLEAYAAAGVQTTVLGALAAAIYAATVRRQPRVAATALRAAFVLLPAISLLAVCPLPADWQSLALADRMLAGGSRNQPVASAEPHAEMSAGLPQPGVRLQGLLAPLRRLFGNSSSAGESEASLPPRRLDWRKLLAVGLACGVGVSVLRLAWGFHQARRLLRRSRVLREPRLFALRDELGARLGLRCACELRESDEVLAAVTAAWLRPTLILASDWRQWTADELRAALAHELAHVARRDCLLALLSAAAAAIHFYHPLLWWLRRRLLLAQELVADELAAACFQRSDAYLLAVSRLALRHDGRPTGGPVLSFFGSFSTLMRRLEMLQDKDVRRGARVRPVMQGVVVAGLLMAAILASSLRMSAVADEPAADQAVPPERVAKREPALFTERPRIELRYLNPENQGFWSLRPTAVFAHKDARAFKDLLDNAVNDWLHAHGVSAALSVSVADVEQASGPILVTMLDPNGPPGQRGQVQFGIDMLRTTKAYPWSGLLKPLAPATAEAEYRGMRVIEWSENPLPIIGPSKSHVVADDRTLLPAWTAKSVDRFRSRAEAPAADDDGALSDCWREVEPCIWAALLDNRTGSWTGTREALEGELPMVKLIVDCRFAAAGVDWRGDAVLVRMVGECKSDETAQALADELKRLLETAQADTRELLRQLEAGAEPGPEDVLLRARTALALCENAAIQRDGRRIRFNTHAPLPQREIIALLSAEFFGAEPGSE
jgi:beta-lactamase regulating signal transducer with metallopeptidase domain